jgi:hypothetical protein
MWEKISTEFLKKEFGKLSAQDVVEKSEVLTGVQGM